MPTSFLTDAKRNRLNDFPREIPGEDIMAYYTLSASDRVAVPVTSSPPNRLGFAVQLGTIRYLGFCPALSAVPRAVVAFVADQLGVDADTFADYGLRRRTVSDHFIEAQAHLGLGAAPPGFPATRLFLSSDPGLEPIVEGDVALDGARCRH